MFFPYRRRQRIDELNVGQKDGNEVRSTAVTPTTALPDTRETGDPGTRTTTDGGGEDFFTQSDEVLYITRGLLTALRAL